MTFSANGAVLAAKSLADALTYPFPVAPLAQVGDTQPVSIQQISTILYASLVKLQASPIAAPRVPLTTATRSPNPAAPPRVTPLQDNIIPTRQQSQRGPHLVEPNNTIDEIIVHPRRYNIRLAPTPTSGPHYIAAQVLTQYTATFVTRARYVDATRHLIANFFIYEVTGKSLKYQKLFWGTNQKIWTNSLSNNKDRLAQGIGTHMPTSTNTVLFIRKCDVPNSCTVT